MYCFGLLLCVHPLCHRKKTGYQDFWYTMSYFCIVQNEIVLCIAPNFNTSADSLV